MGKTKLSSLLKSFLDSLCLCLSPSSVRCGRGRDSEDGHLIYNNGDLLKDRYEVVNTLGEGTFGKVLQCVDHGRGGVQTAVKVIKSQEKFREAAKLEIKVLEKIRESDPLKQHHCVQMLCWFNHSGHVCIVFELLSLSTFDFLKDNGFVPYPLHHIRHMAYQVCDAVRFLHDNRLTHTDLKPENVLFVSSDYDTVYNLAQKRHEKRVRDSRVQLVDFGSATFDQEHHSAVVSTRHYRAPEVILELGWSHQCDVWSIGCVLFEYYQGCTLYQTHDNREHLGMMEKILGPLPPKMLHASRKLGYVRHSRPDWRDNHKPPGRSGKDRVKPLRSYLLASGAEHVQFFDLLEAMLQYQPTNRISLSSVLKHPFFLPLLHPSPAANQEWRTGR